jgi:hypothetical protein
MFEAAELYSRGCEGYIARTNNRRADELRFRNRNKWPLLGNLAENVCSRQQSFTVEDVKDILRVSATEELMDCCFEIGIDYLC